MDAAKRRRAAVLTTAVFAATPLVASAAPRHHSTPAQSSGAAAGVVYGGVTSDGFGLMVETNKSRSRISRMATGLELECTSDTRFSMPDGWTNISIENGKFSSRFGPMTQRQDDGTTVDFEGAVSGKLNRAKTRISGTWSLKGTEHDTAGAVTDTCHARIRWTAKQ
jgi:hypothetical protein